MAVSVGCADEGAVRSGPDHRCLGGVAGSQLVVPTAVAVGGDGTDLAIAHLAHVQPAGDHVTVGCVLGLDVLGDKAGARRQGADHLDLDGTLGDGAQLLAERCTGSFHLEAPQRWQQVIERVGCKQVVARGEVAEAAMELGGERLCGSSVEGSAGLGGHAGSSGASPSAFVPSRTPYEVPLGPHIARLSHFRRMARWVRCTITGEPAYSRSCS